MTTEELKDLTFRLNNSANQIINVWGQNEHSDNMREAATLIETLTPSEDVPEDTPEKPVTPKRRGRPAKAKT